MPISRSAIRLAAAALLSAAGGGTLRAQDDALSRALDLEQAGKNAEAAAAFRAVLYSQSAVPAMLGLERVYAEMGQSEALVPVIDSAVRALPRNPVLRTIQLRTLRAVGRDDAARTAFERWVREVPGDAAPYREYARLLMQDGRSATADTVLQRAQRAFRGGREFAIEVAQLRAAMGMWEPSARSWRAALDESPYLVQAAVYALAPAPESSREALRQTFMALPLSPGSRRILAALEVGWGNARAGWLALRELQPGDSTAAAWQEFAESAEGAEAWLAARDALVAVHGYKRSPKVASRAAADALAGGDAMSALRLAEDAASLLDSASAAREVLPLQVRALTALGRAPDAERVVAAYAAALGPDERAQLTRSVAWGWLRAGDLPRARAALAAAGEDGDDETAGWLAFYEGNLKDARTMLRRSEQSAPDQVTALAVVARTKVERAPAVGDAFLTLARGDSARAATKLAAAAAEVPDAAPLLLAAAARLHAARKDDDGAIALWRTIVAQHERAPEAAEADLEWARALRRKGANSDAVARLEHLILTYPQSALVPQARRELELARGAVPGAT
jgi:tetratricopeptide (TPR) repeat protein